MLKRCWLFTLVLGYMWYKCNLCTAEYDRPCLLQQHRTRMHPIRPLQARQPAANAHQQAPDALASLQQDDQQDALLGQVHPAVGANEPPQAAEAALAANQQSTSAVGEQHDDYNLTYQVSSASLAQKADPSCPVANTGLSERSSLHCRLSASCTMPSCPREVSRVYWTFLDTSGLHQPSWSR